LIPDYPAPLLLAGAALAWLLLVFRLEHSTMAQAVNMTAHSGPASAIGSVKEQGK